MLALAVRLLALVGAPLVAAATVSQGWLSTSEAMAEGGTVGEGVWRYLCYFTVLTNTFVVLVLARAVLRPSDGGGLNSPRVELMAVTSILFVGAVYNLLLAHLWDPQGLRKINDVILHNVSPLLFAAYWLLRRHGALNWRDALFASSWPAAYTAYAQVRGAFDGFYPYFFTDPTRTPWSQVALNMIGLMAVFGVSALLLVMLSNMIRRSQPQI